MKNKLTTFITLAGMTTLLVGSAAALPASVSAAGLGASLGLSATAAVTATGTGVGVGVGAKVSAALVTRMTTRANAEITRRVNALNALSTRVNEMQKLSSSEQASLSSSVQAQISTLTTLQAKITADGTDTTQLRADVQSITSSYRIFALIIPQGAIEAASDRVLTIVGNINTLAGVLQTRITSSTAAGANTTAAVAAMTDMNAKTADAQTQANAAVAEVSPLTPDMGSQTQLAANTAALKDARSKIQAAQQDLIAARKNAGTIVKDLRSFEAAASASATVTATVTATTTASSAAQ